MMKSRKPRGEEGRGTKGGEQQRKRGKEEKSSQNTLINGYTWVA